LTTPESGEQPDPSQDTDITLIEQFSKLRVRQDRAVYYGPNCRYALITEFSEIFSPPKKKRVEVCELLKNIYNLLKDETFSVTSFPFDVISSTESSLHAMLPQKTVCDRLVERYFVCCDSVFTIVGANSYWEHYLLMWSAESPPKGLLALTFLMIAIAARSLNEGHELLHLVSTEGQVGALKMSQRWKKIGQLALSQNSLFQRSSITNIQAVLLLCLLEDQYYVRWNLMGLLGSMTKIAGLYRDPDAFQELDENGRNTRRYNPFRR
jgi:hypothetical protein